MPAKTFEIFAVLSVETRLKILKALKDGPLCVNALTCRTGVSQPAVSQHLRVLKAAGFVKAAKRGCWTHYCLNISKLKSGQDAIAELFKSMHV